MKPAIALRAAIVATLAAALLCACQTNPNELAMKIGAPQAGAVEIRALQTKRLDDTNSISVLNAGTQVLQDLGFTIQESASDVGVISASKNRDAQEVGQVAGAITVAVVGALFGVYTNPTWDEDQVIYVTLVESPIAGSNQVDLRVSFDRTVRNNQNMHRAEIISEPKIYQDFFDKFAQSLFLEKRQ